VNIFKGILDVDISTVQNFSTLLPSFFNLLGIGYHLSLDILWHSDGRLEPLSEFGDLLEYFPYFSVSVSLFSDFTDVIVKLFLISSISALKFFVKCLPEIFVFLGCGFSAICTICSDI